MKSLYEGGWSDPSEEERRKILREMKLSCILRSAVIALRESLKHLEVKYDTEAFHEYDVVEDITRIDMAGAMVLFATEGAGVKRTLSRWDAPKATRDVWRKIDAMRAGDFIPGLLVDGDVTENQRKAMQYAGEKVRAAYNTDIGLAPVEIYLHVAEVLEKVGL